MSRSGCMLFSLRRPTMMQAAICNSSNAKFRPMQERGPIRNGMYAFGSRGPNPLLSDKNRSGLHSSANGQNTCACHERRCEGTPGIQLYIRIRVHHCNRCDPSYILWIVISDDVGFATRAFGTWHIQPGSGFAPRSDEGSKCQRYRSFPLGQYARQVAYPWLPALVLQLPCCTVAGSP